MACPFAFCLIFCIFLIFYKFYSKQNIFVILENILKTTTLTIFFFQSSLITNFLDFFNCTYIENNYYRTNYLLEKCELNDYFIWQMLIIIMIFYFTFLAPLVWLLISNKNELYTDKILTKIGFLLNGYCPQYCYWY